MMGASGDLDFMPPEAPLLMAEQSLTRAPPVLRQAKRDTQAKLWWRLAALGPATALAVALVIGVGWWIGAGRASPGEATLMLLIGFSLVWITLSVSSVVLALIHLPGRPPRARPGCSRPVKVAILVPVRDEATAEVMGNIAAMRAALASGPQRHRYAFFVLSDTRDDAIATDEMRAITQLQRTGNVRIPVHYRRRRDNTNRKVGNLHDWITRWGAAWEAMIVLDADSLMSGAAIRQLTDALADDPDAGLIQSFPELVEAKTLFGRMQEFASSVYGWLPAEGLALWAGTEGNFWGHNAIIRVRAFAQSARLPHLRGRGGAPQLILSHDFVEAGLLRRAGWSVRFLTRPGGSYEEPPATLVDYVLRDRRWCRGNMQHLRLLFARGFHPMSRFHLLHGATAYLLSPAWLAFMVIWAALLPRVTPPDSYFTADNPLYPVWPIWSELTGIAGGWMLAAIIALLLFPKIAAAGLMMRTPGVLRRYRGPVPFLASTATEIVLAVIYAPILMVQQTKAVLRAAIGRPEVWAPQRRGRVTHGWGTLLRFHWLEVTLGAALIWGIAAGVLSGWLVLVTASLIAAPVLSKLSGLRVSGRPLGPLAMATPKSLRVPRVVRVARGERVRMQAVLAAPGTALPVAAE